MFDFMLLTDAGSFEFCGDPVTLGRDRRCSFVLPDSSVMPLHAAIVAGDGTLLLEKRHRDALTFVNRAPIHSRVPLYDGDLIDIGPWTLVIRSRHLPRRANPPHPADLSLEVTPTDQAIVRLVRIPAARARPARASDDTSSIIIII